MLPIFSFAFLSLNIVSGTVHSFLLIFRVFYDMQKIFTLYFFLISVMFIDMVSHFHLSTLINLFYHGFGMLCENIFSKPHLSPDSDFILFI